MINTISESLKARKVFILQHFGFYEQLTELQIRFWVNGYIVILIIFNCVLAKTTAYFYWVFFYPTFFCEIRLNVCHVFFLNEAIENLHAYLLLKYQTIGFCHTTKANLVPLLTYVSRINFAIFTFIVIPQNT